MIYNFEELRPVSTYPKYPPYVESDNGYIETYFYNFFLKNQDKFAEKGKVLIPIWWTTLMVEGISLTKDIQQYINVLPKNMNWFAVSQLDDGIRYQLPPNTPHFSAGGLGGGIPIPLVCDPIPNYTGILHHPDPLWLSFVGSTTHPIRKKLYDWYESYVYSDHKVYFSEPKNWSQTVPHGNLLDFVNVTRRSKFALAPRGYGLSSFRLYEIMQLGSVPVYVSDKHWLPFEDELNWNEFCVIVKEEEIPMLRDRLNAISKDEYAAMKKKIAEVYPKYFTLEGMSQQILKRL